MSDLETIECAEEVRHGLFRYKWCFEEKMQKDGDVHKKSFKLTGSEAGRTFTIDYRLSKHKKNFGKFFTFKENLSKGNSTVSELDLTVPNQQEVSQLEQSFAETKAMATNLFSIFTSFPTIGRHLGMDHHAC
jgi:hypothetical protein